MLSILVQVNDNKCALCQLLFVWREFKTNIWGLISILIFEREFKGLRTMPAGVNLRHQLISYKNTRVQQQQQVLSDCERAERGVCGQDWTCIATCLLQGQKGNSCHLLPWLPSTFTHTKCDLTESTSDKHYLAAESQVMTTEPWVNLIFWAVGESEAVWLEKNWRIIVFCCESFYVWHIMETKWLQVK